MNRTYPSHNYFENGQIGQHLLKRILTTYAKYDPKIGYIQGMNFIAALFLYHSSEIIAFWLFVALIEDYELREVFLPSNELCKYYRFPRIV